MYLTKNIIYIIYIYNIYIIYVGEILYLTKNREAQILHKVSRWSLLHYYSVTFELVVEICP